jgi:hypothetical protein
MFASSYLVGLVLNLTPRPEMKIGTRVHERQITFCKILAKTLRRRVPMIVDVTFSLIFGCAWLPKVLGDKRKTGLNGVTNHNFNLSAGVRQATIAPCRQMFGVRYKFGTSMIV